MIHINRLSFFPLLIMYAVGLQSAHAELSIGANISIEHDHQSFGSSDADLSTLSFSPNMTAGNWYFAIDIPWQKVDGGISQNQRPRLDQACSLLNTGRALPARFSNLRNSILQYCSAQPNSEGSGISDIGVLASYGLSHGYDSPWFSSLSLSYQSDNGEAKEGLGSGTQDSIFEWSLFGDFQYVSTSFNIGYNFVVGGEFESVYDNYGFASFSLSSPTHKSIVFGAGYQFQQASAEYIDSLSTFDFFGEFTFKKYYTLRLSYLNYLDAEFYPNYSLNAAMHISF